MKNGKNVIQIDDKGIYRVSRIQSISQHYFDVQQTKWTNDIVDSEDFLYDGDIIISHIESVEHIGKTAAFPKLDEKIIHGIN